MRATPHPGWRAWLTGFGPVVGALTAIAFAVRLLGFHESLFADEIYSYRIVANYGFLGVVREVHDTAITPPLHYLLAHGAVTFGEDATWIRMPSIVLGTATVPLVYLLGTRTVGRTAGLFGAMVAAIAPFAVFYGTEARAYATLMFLCVLSTLALLIALQDGRRRWLVVYAAASALVLYAHYSGIFVVTAQALWAMVAHRERLRELLVANVAIGLAYLPWVPSFFYQGDEHPPEQISLVSPVTLESFKDAVLATFPGRPFVDLDVVPGTVALWVIGGAILGAIAVLAARFVSRREPSRPRPSEEVVLLAILAVATPIGISVYSLAETSLFGPRNLAASLPAAWLLLGRLLTAPRGAVAVIAAGAVTAALALGTVKSLDEDYRRPPYRDVAAALDARARTCEPVVEVLWLSPMNALSKALAPQLRAGHPVARITPSNEDGWRDAAGARTVWVVAPQVQALRGQSWGRRLGAGYRLRSREIFPGAIPVALYRYERESGPWLTARLVSAPDGEHISRGAAPPLPVESPDDPGALDVVKSERELLTVLGWTIDSAAGEAADRVYVFDRGGCLVLSGRPDEPRPDVARARGKDFLHSGFKLYGVPGDTESLAQPGALRVFGASRTGAWQLPATPTAYLDRR